MQFSKLSFNEVVLQEVEKYLKDLNSKKYAIFNNIPSKYLKETSDICGNIITQLVNGCIKDCDFPNKWKLADLTQIHKCEEKTSQMTYRPIIILPVLSKIYEKVMQKQINHFIDAYLSLCVVIGKVITHNTSS